MPDFRKFRSGGELSDVQVSVEGEIFKLHRFPLYTRSDFFLKEFAKQAANEDQVILLDKFPGGKDVFTIVADFCYNISISIMPENAFALKCAAKYLEMNGSGNLHEKTGLFIEECMASVKRGKALDRLLAILSSIPKYQAADREMAKTISDQCVSAIAYHWSKCQYGTSGVSEVTSPEILTIFLDMDFGFFVSVMASCKEQLQNHQVLNALISEYILHVLHVSSCDYDDAKSGEDEAAGTSSNGGLQPTDGLEVDTEEANGGEVGLQSKLEFTESRLTKIKTLLDCVKPDLSSTRSTSATRWLRPLLSAYAKVEGSDEVLGGIAASMANQIDGECVSTMSEETLLHFAERISPDTLSEQTKAVLVDHMLALSANQKLSAAGYTKLVSLLTLSSIPAHDALLDIIGNLCKQGLTEEELNDCLCLVNMKMCSVKCLRRLATENSLPSDQIAVAALDLCESLQQRLDATTRVIQEQEKEISSLSIQTFGISPPERDSLSQFMSGGLYHSGSLLQSNGSSPFYREIPQLTTAGSRPSSTNVQVPSQRRDARSSRMSPTIYDSHKLTGLLGKHRQSRFK